MDTFLHTAGGVHFVTGCDPVEYENEFLLKERSRMRQETTCYAGGDNELNKNHLTKYN